MMYGTRYGICALITAFTFAGLLAASGMAAASPLSDITDSLNDALFGGANLFAAQAILTAAVLVSVGLALAVLHLEQTATFIVLFAVLGALTAIGWANPMLILVAALLAVALFVKKVTAYWTGSGGTDAGET